jgi:hypothetical protein
VDEKDAAVTRGVRCVLPLAVGALAVLAVLVAPNARAQEAEAPLVFAAIGDFGRAGENEQAVAALVTSWNPSFIITVGDNNYDEGKASTIDQNIGQYYHAWIAPYTGAYGAGADTNRFFPSPGNHDWVTTGANPYREYFTLPGNERYYEDVWAPVHLFALDSDPHEPDGTTSTSTQAAWLEDRLAASTACWKLVYFHHPPFSSGPHGSDPRMQWPFKAWGASVVLAGHDHTYERLREDGLTYIVNGLGGASSYDFEQPVSGSLVRYRDGYGAMRITATRTAITYDFITTDGTVIDSYSETGGCSQ